jgi:hypothetical protein
VLGLQVKDNVPYRDSERWLTVASLEEPDGVELALHLAHEPARAFRQTSRELGRPVLSLSTDCQRDAEQLKANSVVFVQDPAKRDYGGTDAVFDHTFGNLINLHQD